MAHDMKLTDVQKIKLRELEPKLRHSVKICNYQQAKSILTELQLMLPKSENRTRLMQFKNWFFECAIEDNQIEFAISGLSGVLKNTNSNTRVHLEALALMSVALIRKKDIQNSKIYMNKVINKIKVIKSNQRRISFYNSYIERISDEIVLSVISGNGTVDFDVDDIHEKAIQLIQTKNENEIYELMGNFLPSNSLALLNDVQNYVLKQIPDTDRLLLPPPITDDKKREIGMKFNGALKRVLWKALCDPQNEIYKAWSEGLAVVHDKKYIAATVTAVFIKNEIGIGMLAASVVALAIRFGVGLFCELFEPDILMDRVKK